MTWNALGLRDSQEPWLQDRIKATNSVFAILFGVLLLLLATSVIFSTRVMTLFIVASLFILLITIIIHAVGYNKVSRVLVAILPVIVASCIQGAYQSENDLPNASGWVFITAFQVLPFLLFAPSENFARYIAIFINLATSAGYEQFNTWIELAQPPITPPIQVLITNMIGLLMMLKLLTTIDLLYVKSNRANELLIAKVEKEREEQRAARAALDKTVQALNEAKNQEEQRAWATKGIAEATKILRDDKDISKMFDTLISFIVKYVKANQGGIFIVTEADNGDRFLELKCCYAYERKRFLKKRIALGEGLVGQCYYERTPIFLTDIPQNYVQITSGLGMATPSCAMIIPMMHNDDVHGVMEIASFTKLSPHEVEFLTDIGEAIAIALNSLLIGEQTKQLLSETQMMTEQLRLQDEAMRQSMEEIAATQEEQERKEAELRRIIEQQRIQIELLKHQPQASIMYEN